MKYPLSIVNHLLNVINGHIGLGYDIGCKFKSTVEHSSLGERAAGRYTSLLGGFHGHAHTRLCQVDNLTNYIKGLGLEDLEGCETFFSVSNELASITRNASVFHRHQAITNFLRFRDRMETYASLSE